MIKINIEIEDSKDDKTIIKIANSPLEEGTLSEKNSCIMINNYLKELLSKEVGAKKKTPTKRKTTKKQ